MTPETIAQLILWRAKAVDGTLTQEEMKASVLLMREDRKRAGPSTGEASRRKKAKAEIKSADEMLDELGNI